MAFQPQIRRNGRLRLRGLKWGMISLLALTAACRPRPSEPPLVPPSAEPDPSLEVSASLTGGRWVLVDPSRKPLWEVHFERMDLLQASARRTSAVRRARCRSLRPGLDTLLQAERLVWDVPAQRLTLEGVKASSLQERAWFRVPRAQWQGDREVFHTAGPVHFQRGEVHLQGQRLTADTGLRTARLEPVTAQARVGGREVWSAQAQAAEATRQQVRLTQTSGRLTGTEPAVTFSAPQVAWRLTDQVLVLEGNLEVQSPGTVVTTSDLTWDRRKDQWKGTHPLTVQRGDWQVRGTGLAAPTDLQTLRIAAPSATLTTDRATFQVRGRTVELTPEGRVRLRQVRATLRPSGQPVEVTALEARWDPGPQTLSLVGGVRAVWGARTAQLSQVTWSARSGRWIGRGPVSVQEESGGRLTGDRFEGHTGWQTWSLTGVEWTFQDAGRHQDWTARARRAWRRADGLLALQQVVGTLRDATGPLNLTADGLRWSPPGPVVTAEGRVRVEAPVHGFRLRADRLEWHRDRQQIIASGEIEGASGLQSPTPLKWSGLVRRWVYDLATQRVVAVQGRTAP